jgi:hypothetical protein
VVNFIPNEETGEITADKTYSDIENMMMNEPEKPIIGLQSGSIVNFSGFSGNGYVFTTLGLMTSAPMVISLTIAEDNTVATNVLLLTAEPVEM